MTASAHNATTNAAAFASAARASAASDAFSAAAHVAAAACTRSLAVQAVRVRRLIPWREDCWICDKPAKFNINTANYCCAGSCTRKFLHRAAREVSVVRRTVVKALRGAR